MTGRGCHNCKHFETMPSGDRGWCRHPRLPSGRISPLVESKDLACAFGGRILWEAAKGGPLRATISDQTASESLDLAAALARVERGGEAAHPNHGSARVPTTVSTAWDRMTKMPDYMTGMMGQLFSARGRRLTPAFTGPGGHNAAADTQRPSPTLMARSGPPPPSGGQRVPPTGGGGQRPERGNRMGQERSVSYQPEERYWTDYLRIALPVVGLLLMLGLFLFWAEQLIGDGSATPPVETPDVAMTLTAASPTATPTEEVDIAADGGTPPAANGDATEPATTQVTPTATATPTEVPDEPEDPTLAIGQTASVTENSVRLREGPSTTDEIVRELSQNQVVTILDGPTAAGGYNWWQVQTDDEAIGWVADSFLNPQ